MKSSLKAVLIGAVTSALCVGGAFADTIGLGLSVNGTCYVGTCPPAPMAFGAHPLANFSFDVTLSNGDMFNIAGAMNATNSTNGLSISNGGGFTAEYLGGPNGTSQNDILTLAMLWSYHMGSTSGTISNAVQAISGS